MGRRKSSAFGRVENYKLTLLGCGAVGKSSLIKRFIDGYFSSDYNSTVEDVYQYFLRLNQRLINLTIVDSSGTYAFPAMKDLSLKDSAAFILVLAVDDKHSFRQLNRDFQQIVNVRPDAKIMVAGNKADSDKRIFSAFDVVSYLEEQRVFFPECECKYMETSAKTNHNVEEIFTEAIKLLRPNTNNQAKDYKTKHLNATCTIL